MGWSNGRQPCRVRWFRLHFQTSLHHGQSERTLLSFFFQTKGNKHIKPHFWMFSGPESFLQNNHQKPPRGLGLLGQAVRQEIGQGLKAAGLRGLVVLVRAKQGRDGWLLFFFLFFFFRFFSIKLNVFSRIIDLFLLIVIISVNMKQLKICKWDRLFLTLKKNCEVRNTISGNGLKFYSNFGFDGTICKFLVKHRTDLWRTW